MNSSVRFWGDDKTECLNKKKKILWTNSLVLHDTCPPEQGYVFLCIMRKSWGEEKMLKRRGLQLTIVINNLQWGR